MFVWGLALSAHAAELEAGKIYGPGSTVSAKVFGVSLTVPKAWNGQIDGEHFVISQGIEGMVALRVDKVTLQEAKEFLSSPQDLGEGYFFRPNGTPKVSKDQVSVDCTIINGATQWPDETTIRVGKHGYGVGVIATGDPSVVDKVKGVGRQVVKSVKFKKPFVPKPGKSSGKWVSEVKGQKLYLFNTTSNTTSRTTITACADGSFVRDRESSGSTQDVMDTAWASYAGASQYQGKWSVVGDKLHLFYNDGDKQTYALTKNEEGHFLMDGDRWLREEATDCR
jgi:hypothetical protein